MDDGFTAKGMEEFSKNPNSGLSYRWYFERWMGKTGDLPQAQEQAAAAAEHGYEVQWRVAGPKAAEMLQQGFNTMYEAGTLKMPIEVVYSPP